MTDRERFEVNAKNNGATIAISEATLLKFISTNGAVITTCFFDEAGKFVNYSTETHF